MLCSEAVTGVVGRAELLSSIFFLLSIQAYTDTNSKQINQCTARDNKCKHEDKIANVDFSCSLGYKFSSLMQVTNNFFNTKIIQSNCWIKLNENADKNVSNWEFKFTVLFFILLALFQACFLAALAMVSKEQGITVIGKLYNYLKGTVSNLMWPHSCMSETQRYP